MNDLHYWELIRAGYKPEQILSCWPCKCKQNGQPVKDCTFPTHRAGLPLTETGNL